MDLIKLYLISLSLLLSGCGISYYGKVGYHQLDILLRAEKIEDLLAEKKLSPEETEKLEWILEVRKFGSEALGLKESSNYTKYSKLDNPYVSYVVNANEEFNLEPYKWSYPIVGDLSYKGYPTKKEALLLLNEMKSKGYDANLRGVSAYSTLGWFSDPVLSSMMSYSKPNLVNLILHENTHATIYVKSNSEFNEQLATYVGNLGTEIFYQAKAPNMVDKLKLVRQDKKIFYDFVDKQKKSLKKLYGDKIFKSLSLEEKRKQKQLAFQKIKDVFKKEIQGKLKLLSFNDILRDDLNNAHLALYGTYTDNQDLFAKLYQQKNKDFKAFISHLKSYESEKQPLEKLKMDLKKLD